MNRFHDLGKVQLNFLGFSFIISKREERKEIKNTELLHYIFFTYLTVITITNDSDFKHILLLKF